MTLRTDVVRFLVGVGVLGLIMGGVGCQTAKPVYETYTRPGEINMTGRKHVVLEPISDQGRNGSAADSITSRLRAALIAKNFTVLDRASWNAIATENAIGAGDAAGADVESASVLIRGKILDHRFNHSTESRNVKYQDGSVGTVYRAVGSAFVEVGFDVVDLRSTKVITSSSVRGEKSGATDFFNRPPSLDPASLYSDAYVILVHAFMKKLAPYREIVQHTLYPIREVPRVAAGIALMRASQPKQALEEFRAALTDAQSLPSVKGRTLAQMRHNIAAALEASGEFDAAADEYTEAARMGAGLDEGTSIARCRQRQSDLSRLKEQGVGQ